MRTKFSPILQAIVASDVCTDLQVCILLLTTNITEQQIRYNLTITINERSTSPRRLYLLCFPFEDTTGGSAFVKRLRVVRSSNLTAVTRFLRTVYYLALFE